MAATGEGLVLSSCMDSLPHSQLLSRSVPYVPSFGCSFLLAVMGQTLLCHCGAWWSSALHFVLCVGVVTKVRAAWQGDEESSSAHLQDKEQCLLPVDTQVLQLW